MFVAVVSHLRWKDKKTAYFVGDMGGDKMWACPERAAHHEHYKSVSFAHNAIAVTGLFLALKVFSG